MTVTYNDPGTTYNESQVTYNGVDSRVVDKPSGTPSPLAVPQARRGRVVRIEDRVTVLLLVTDSFEVSIGDAASLTLTSVERATVAVHDATAVALEPAEAVTVDVYDRTSLNEHDDFDAVYDGEDELLILLAAAHLTGASL